MSRAGNAELNGAWAPSAMEGASCACAGRRPSGEGGSGVEQRDLGGSPRRR
jgi:hypothetical protein